MFVRRAGRSVDEEVGCAWGPEDVGDELSYHCGLFGAAPDYGAGAAGEEEGEREGVEGAARWDGRLFCVSIL